MRRMKQDRFIIYFLRLYNLVWKSILPFMKKNARLEQGFQKRTSASHFKKADIWIHAASAGEAYLAVHIIKAIDPELLIRVLVTTSTSQGRQILDSELKQSFHPPGLSIQTDWMPFDIPEVMEKTIFRINPSVMVLLETEIWPALLFYLKKNHSRIIIVNGRLSPGSFKIYKATKFLWSGLFPDRILATTIADMKRFRVLFKRSGINLMPNIKFENLLEESTEKNELGNILDGKSPFIILSSVRKQEEKDVEKILLYLTKRNPNLVTGLFPRHMHRVKAWKKRLSDSGLIFVLKSELTSPAPPGTIILWDTFGELKKAYAYADAAFVGGSLRPLGGQNFIEPAVSGVATVTGPFIEDFEWVGNGMFQNNTVCKANNYKEVAGYLLEEGTNNGNREKRKRAAKDYLLKKRGGAEKAASEILQYLD